MDYCHYTENETTCCLTQDTLVPQISYKDWGARGARASLLPPRTGSASRSVASRSLRRATRPAAMGEHEQRHVGRAWKARRRRRRRVRRPELKRRQSERRQSERRYRVMRAHRAALQAAPPRAAQAELAIITRTVLEARHVGGHPRRVVWQRDLREGRGRGDELRIHEGLLRVKHRGKL